MKQYECDLEAVFIEGDYIQDVVKKLNKWLKEYDVWIWDIIFEVADLRATVYYRR